MGGPEQPVLLFFMRSFRSGFESLFISNNNQVSENTVSYGLISCYVIHMSRLQMETLRLRREGDEFLYSLLYYEPCFRL